MDKDFDVLKHIAIFLSEISSSSIKSCNTWAYLLLDVFENPLCKNLSIDTVVYMLFLYNDLGNYMVIIMF